MKLAIAQKCHVTKEIMFIRTADAAELERWSDQQEWYGFQGHFEKPEGIKVLPESADRALQEFEAQISELARKIESLESRKAVMLMRAFKNAPPALLAGKTARS